MQQQPRDAKAAVHRPELAAEDRVAIINVARRLCRSLCRCSPSWYFSHLSSHLCRIRHMSRGPGGRRIDGRGNWN